jgi:hypothetical protein
MESEGRERHLATENYNIPSGHMPPPRICRIRYPDYPPGKEPPSGDCDYFRYRVPPGAWFVDG